jgi:hypothetical protein
MATEGLVDVLVQWLVCMMPVTVTMSVAGYRRWKAVVGAALCRRGDDLLRRRIVDGSS